MQRLRIGTRKSKLALWQSYKVQELLHIGGIESDLVPIDTTGDRVLDLAISKIGSKGVFTEEIEESLRTGAIDLAVHSAKDMPSELPGEFELLAFTQREKANDVLVSFDPAFQLNQSGVRIGTSSTRRIAFLKHYFPAARPIEIRGNLQTRLAKMQSGHCDALLLAFAGAHRMGYDHLMVAELPLTQFIPPAGQGSITLESRIDLDIELKQKVRGLTNDLSTERCISAERSFLKAMQGGCSVPIYSYAQLEKNKIHLTAGIISLDGSKMITDRQSTDTDPNKLGKSVAANVLQKGGDQILVAIKRALGS